MALDQRFRNWEEAQGESFKPRTTGYVGKGSISGKAKVTFWPTRVDVYYDLSAAGVWNTYRAVRCTLISLTMSLSKSIGGSELLRYPRPEADRLFDDFSASIPFHLTEDLPSYLKDGGEQSVLQDLGKSLGGLLLMHPLYVLSQLDIVQPQTRQRMRDCLAW